jgi:5-methyltetrahydrofolate--homocysteine methyltransferase
MRPLLNAAFVTAAAAHGLDAAIVNPNDLVVMEAIRTANADRASGEVPSTEQAWALWDAAFADAMAATEGSGEPEALGREGGTEQSAAERLMAAVARGDADGAPALVDAAIESGMPATDVIPEVLTPAIQTLGDAYGRGEVFLPQLIVSAEAMKAAVARAKTYMPGSSGFEQGRVVFATVQGDIHSIGKDICVSLLESQGFLVSDLGVDVAPDVIAQAAADADAVCLSALMTTTLRAMSESIDSVLRTRPDVPVLVGGAVVTREWAESVGAGYADDAPGCVSEVRSAIAARRSAG